MAWLTEADIRDELNQYSAWQQNPVLPTGDLDKIIAKFQLYTIWLPSTSYDWGARVVPTVRTGYHWKSLQSGVSGTTEPVWPIHHYSAGFESFLTNFEESTRERIADGTVLWEQGGTDNGESLWDMNAILHKAWMEKASLASKLMGVQAGRNRFDLRDIYLNCLSMARQYKTTRFA
jgi:hypothetical protein